MPGDLPSTILDVLLDRADRMPSSAAIQAPGRADLTYRDLLDQIREAVAALNRFGFGRGDRIAIALPQGPECPVALVSLMCGCVCVPLNPGFSVAEQIASFRRARVVALVTRFAAVPDAALAA